MLAVAVALAPTLTFQWLAWVVIVLAAVCIVFWMLSKVPMPEPFNYVAYALLAIIALWLLFKLAGKL